MTEDLRLIKRQILDLEAEILYLSKLLHITNDTLDNETYNYDDENKPYTYEDDVKMAEEEIRNQQIKINSKRKAEEMIDELNLENDYEFLKNFKNNQIIKIKMLTEELDWIRSLPTNEYVTK